MHEKNWMIYGCYGYTGSLVVEEAVSRGLRPVLAGRSRRRVGEMAERLGLEFRCFEADSPENAVSGLQGMSVLLNCAGPFAITAPPLTRACLKTGSHYLDITGEIEVLEHLHGMDGLAKRSGIVVCPAVGFDVIPTDCLAAALKEVVPDARYLALAFDSKSPVSPGTAVTILEGLRQNGKIRRRKVIATVPLAHKTRRIDFGRGEKTAVTIPWGDVSAAFYTTGIPEIEVYAPVPDKAIKWIKLLRFFRPLLFIGPIRKGLAKLIRVAVKGPSDAERKNARVDLWAEAVGSDGRSRTALLKTANGYDVTVHGSLGVVEKLLETSAQPGVYTPSRLMGSRYVCELPGSGPIRIDS